MNAEENTVAHLEMIQGVINRMGGNAFAVKTWSVGLVAALFAVAGQASGLASPWLFRVALGAVVIFAVLDMAYLRQERLFRHLYDAARNGQVKEPFSMNTSDFKGKDNVRWWSVLKSWSVWPLYAPLALAVLIVGFTLAGRL